MTFSIEILGYQKHQMGKAVDLTHDFSIVQSEHSIMDYPELADHAQTSIKNHAKNLAKYPDPRGYLPLRELIQSKKFQHTATTDNIWITNGAAGAFILICDILLKPGDTVLVEQYCYQGFLRELRKRKANIIQVEADQDGLSPEALEHTFIKLKKEKITPKFIHLMSNFQNPTTSSLPLDRRQAIIELAHQYKTPLIENDSYADFCLENKTNLPSLYDLSSNGNVIYISSFTKLLGCSMRVGFLVAPDILSEAINYAMYGHSPSEIATTCISSYLETHYNAIVKKTAENLLTKRDTIIEAVTNHFPQGTRFNTPQGGMFVWLQLPQQLNSEDLLQQSLKQGIGFLPGTCFSDDPIARQYLRLCFSHNSTDTIYRGVEMLGHILHS